MNIKNYRGFSLLSMSGKDVFEGIATYKVLKYFCYLKENDVNKIREFWIVV